MKNLSFLHSPIVYSTDVSPQIRYYYRIWVATPLENSIKRTQLFLMFIESCEDENKDYLAVMDIINNPFKY